MCLEHLICIIINGLDGSPSTHVPTTTTLGCKMVWLVALAANLAICSTKLFLMVFMPATTVPTLPSAFAVMWFVCGTLLVFLMRFHSTHCCPQAVHVTNNLHLSYHALSGSTDFICLGKSEVRFTE